MVAEKIRNAQLALGEMAGCVSAEQWEFLRSIREDLCKAAKQAERLENCLVFTQQQLASEGN